MGGGIHGGFGNTAGASSRNTSKIFTRVQYRGTVTVDGIVRDVSRRVYQRNDIDFNRRDATGRTNLQRMKNGNAPIGSDGQPIHLHHILQKESGPTAEVREVTHTEYHRALHGLAGPGESFRNNRLLAKQYANFKKKYWRWRASQYIEGKTQ